MKLAYVIYNQCHYYEALSTRITDKFVYEIMVLINPHPRGGLEAEFPIRWYVLSGRQVPRIEAFGDCWKFLSHPRLMALFTDLSLLGPEATPEAVIEVLRVRAEDHTPRTLPEERES